jgi:hypothetical protein
VVGGRAFTIDPRDNIIPFTDDDGEVTCLSGTIDGGPNTPDNIFTLWVTCRHLRCTYTYRIPFASGDVFLHNVVTTFNLVTNTTTLTQRQTY